jgi:hypothetical protein
MVGNGTQPSGNAARRVAEALTHIAARQKKVILCRAQNLLDTANGGGSSTVWRVFFRTSENATAVRVNFGITKSTTAPTGTPTATLRLEGFTTGTSITKVVKFLGQGSAPPISPAAISHSSVVLTGLTPDTEYYGWIALSSQAVLLYATWAEEPDPEPDDTVLGVVSPNKYPVGGPIYDEHIQDLIAAANAHWRHSGAHLFSWTPDYATAVTMSSTSYTIFGNNISCYLPVEYRSTRRRPGSFPVTLAVNATRTSGTGTLDVRLWNGTVAIEMTGISTGGTGDWYRTDGLSMPATSPAWELQAKVSSGVFRIDGVSLYPYES